MIRKWHLITLFLISMLVCSITAQGQSIRRLEKLYKRQKYEKLVLKAEKMNLKHPDNPLVYDYLIRGLLANLETERYREYRELFSPDSVLSLVIDELISSDTLASAIVKMVEREYLNTEGIPAGNVERNLTVPVGDLIVKKAEEVLDVPYLYTGMKPEKGFDCSGLVCWSYGQFGYQLPRRSGLLAKMGTKVSPEEAKTGDLVCFGRIPDDPGSVYHVGMIHSRDADEILMIHSGISEGVSIVPLTSGHWAKEEFFIVRIIE
jgi:hypothetical protein